MSGIDNSGFIIFGADPDSVPPQGPPPPPPPGTAPFNVPPNPSGAAPLGAKFPPNGARCRVHVEYDGGTKIEKASGGGKKGAKQTNMGAKVAEVTVKIHWPDDPQSGPLVEAQIMTISPHGPNAGKAWDWTERFAGIYSVGAVMVEDMKLKPAEGSNDMELSLKLSGFDKNQQTNAGAGQGATPTTSQKYVPPGAPATDPAFPSKPLVDPVP